MGLAGEKEPVAERQSYPCCCPKGFLCATCPLFKLMFCLVLRASFSKAGVVGQQGVVDKDAFLVAANVL